MTKNCVVCGRPFDGSHRQIACSPECAHLRNKANQAIWRAKHRTLRRQKEAEQQRTYTIRKVLDMAEARGVTYGKMVTLLARERKT